MEVGELLPINVRITIQTFVLSLHDFAFSASLSS